MNYAEFREYRHTLPTTITHLDDLNPYKYSSRLSDLNITEKTHTLSITNIFLWKDKGVRPLLTNLFKYFHNSEYEFLLPIDVYPEYFRILPETANISTFQTCLQKNYTLPNRSNIVVLITNPLVPEGRYLSSSEILKLDKWLCSDSSRWLIIDTAYDLTGHAISEQFQSERVIFVGSRAKLFLEPKIEGWALCKRDLINFRFSKSFSLQMNIPNYLESLYKQAWNKIEKDRALNIPGFQKPEVGYLSIVNTHYKILLKQYGISAIPGSVFGIVSPSISVISCLGAINNK